MSKNQKQGDRKPATKFPNLQKKLQKQKVHKGAARAKGR